MTQEFHTHREIMQQPRVWLAAYDMLRGRKAEISRFVNRCRATRRCRN